MQNQLQVSLSYATENSLKLLSVNSSFPGLRL